MRITLLCVGRLKAGPERELFDRYFTRLKGMARSVGVTDVDLREIDESRARRPEDRREEEAAAIAAAVGPRDALVLLDERGASPTSPDWAADIARERDAARSAYVVVVGGPDGLSPGLRARAHKVVSFGAMTWPHQLVRVMAGEQLYRALSILAGHPYHRA
ncbi:23S rRNA (pseudouridine1915-N3)-methyltransferase [Roseiarcus fermentans]|uniref:Ribosomal RNA large subunit methyltransferase H n=1 Tax=Roseiarcus fermentans TaxID=1473586 RepID=A0A366FS52_9HYPH|nr:23S rRNA (pseudouridine(1915)-N(3))-methyltransferase RlmH [Roseiarcus fermentans]RBP16559.1 23S rRNA (pseudouridine1915-N3)-methyltransferase [Roseiarcus fermentans]